MRAPLKATVLALLLPGCLQKPPQTATSEAPARRHLGIWTDHENYTREEVDSVLGAARDMGFNVIFPTVWKRGCSLVGSDVVGAVSGEKSCAFGSRHPEWFSDMLAKAPGYGLEVVPWFEWGFKVPVDSALHKAAKQRGWILQGIPDPAGEVPAQYLDVNKPEVKKLILDMQSEFLAKYKDKIKAVQWDDHLSIRIDSTDPKAAQMQGLLTGFARELKGTIARAGVRAELAHNNSWWAEAKFAAKWKDWGFDGVFAQTFVPQNLKNDVQRSMNEVQGFGLLVGVGRSGASDAAVTSILADQFSQIPANKGVNFFHFDAIRPETRKLFAAYFRGGLEAMHAAIANGCPAGSVCRAFTAAEREACKRFSSNPATCESNRWGHDFYQGILRHLSNQPAH